MGLVADTARPLRPGAHRAWTWIARALDVVIAFYVAALLLILIVGGVNLGWLTISQAAKPMLVLWILVPIRLVLPRPFPFTAPLAGGWARVTSGAAAINRRLPAAVTDTAFAFVVTMVAVTAVGFLVNLLFDSGRQRPFELPFERATLAETFAAWDSGWYFDIAARGYYYTPEGQSSVAFFPLYPMAMRALGWVFGGSDAAIWIAGIVISYAAFFGGLVALHRLTEQITRDREAARRAVLYVTIFPFSFFLTRVYPSGLFFLLVVLAVASAYRSRWWLAGLCGGLAAVTRPHGLLIAIPLGLMALQAPGGIRETVRRVVALSPIPAAVACYSLYVYSLAGHPLAWLSSQSQWGYSLGRPPWEQLLGLIARIERYGLYDYFFTSEMAAFRLFHGTVALLLLAVLPLVFTRLGAPLGLWVLVSLLIPLSGNALEGIGRYAAVLFPVFIVLATLRSPRLHETLLIVWSLFLALFVGLFVTWQPIY